MVSHSNTAVILVTGILLLSQTAVTEHSFDRHTVSGFSSGGDMAIIHFVAYSEQVTGIGIVGGAPYGCQLVPDYGDACGAMTDNATLPWNDWVDGDFFPYTKNRAERQLIDPMEHMWGTNVYLYSGMLDTCVFRPVAKAVERQMRNFTRPLFKRADGWPSAFHTVFDINSEHAWIVDDYVCNSPGRNFTFPYYCGLKSNAESTGDTDLITAVFEAGNGPPDDYNVDELPVGCCGTCDAGGNCDGRNPPAPVSEGFWRPPINHCNYDMSGEMFRILIGSGRPLPKDRTRGNDFHLYQFNQSRYSENRTDAGAANISMANHAFLYIPKECHHGQSGQCQLHVHYHCCACSYNTPHMGRNLMLKQGIIEWAEPNNIIVLYPQTTLKGVAGWYVLMRIC